jgi:nucleoside-diphosphate-sugar epimerase
VISPIHVDDVTEVLVGALRHGRGGVLNVAGEEHVSVECLARQIGRLTGREPVFMHTVDPCVGNLIGDTRRLHSLFSWRPRVRLADGLAEIVARG